MPDGWEAFWLNPTDSNDANKIMILMATIVTEILLFQIMKNILIMNNF